MNRFGGVGPCLRVKHDKAELDLAVTYLCAVAHDEDWVALLESHQDTLAALGGMEGLHGYLWALEALIDDWDELTLIDGGISPEAISESGHELIALDNQDHAEALSAIL